MVKHILNDAYANQTLQKIAFDKISRQYMELKQIKLLIYCLILSVHNKSNTRWQYNSIQGSIQFNNIYVIICSNYLIKKMFCMLLWEC